MDSGNSRRPCFVVEDDGLASLADMEAGFSGSHHHHHHHHHHNQQHNNYAFFSRPLPYASSSVRNLSCSPSSPVCTSPRSGLRFYYDARFEEPLSSFLDSCTLCKKPLGNRDIYMYSDCAFCSEECRQERIDVNDAKEKKRTFSSSMKALRKKEQQRKSTSPTKNQDYPFCTSTVAAA